MSFFDLNTLREDVNGALGMDANRSIIWIDIDIESYVAIRCSHSCQITVDCVALMFIPLYKCVWFRLEVKLKWTTRRSDEIDFWVQTIVEVNFLLGIVSQSWSDLASIYFWKFGLVRRHKKINDLLCIVSFYFIFVIHDSQFMLELFLLPTRSTVQKKEVSERNHLTTRGSFKLCFVHH